MAYDKNNQLLSIEEGSGVTLYEIARCLRDYRLNTDGRPDIGLLATSKKINKFSWVKPIAYNKRSALKHEEFEGMPTDIANGIRFGIELTGSIEAEIGPNMKDMHDAEFRYIQPRGAEYDEPFRFNDFDGYKHDAQANPHASFQSASLVAYFDDEDHSQGSLGGVSVRYAQNNIYGVDFTEIYTDPSESLTNSLQRSYPCILVTDSDGDTYFTALDYDAGDGNAPTARPLYFSGAYVDSPNWSVRFSKPRYQTASSGSTTKPWNENQDNMRATLILIKSFDTLGPYLDSLRQINFSENWIPCIDEMRTYGSPVVLPAPKIGVPLSLREYGAPTAYFTPVAVSYSNGNIGVTLFKTGVSNNTLSVTCRMEVGAAYAIKVATVVGSLNSLPLFSFSASSDLGMAIISGTTYSARVTITTVDGSKTKTTTGVFTFTA